MGAHNASSGPELSVSETSRMMAVLHCYGSKICRHASEVPH